MFLRILVNNEFHEKAIIYMNPERIIKIMTRMDQQYEC